MSIEEWEMADEKSNDRDVIPSLPSRSSMPPFGALRAFDAVARLGGVRKAALGMQRDRSVISRHIRSLEAWIGAVLVERTSSGTKLTKDGKIYHHQITKAIGLIASATTELMQSNANHPLQIWCMPGFALLWLNSRLGDFEQAHSGMNVEVRPTNISPNFDVSDADVDIRFIASYEKDFHLAPHVRSFELAAPALIAVASPEYLDNNKAIMSPNDLLDHHLLHEEDFIDWHEWLSANGTIIKDKLTGPLLWQGHLTLDAAKYGRGVALSNLLIIKDELENGQLIHIGADNPSFANSITGSYLFMAREDRWDWLPIRNFRTWLENETTRAMTRIDAFITK